MDGSWSRVCAARLSPAQAVSPRGAPARGRRATGARLHNPLAWRGQCLCRVVPFLWRQSTREHVSSLLFLFNNSNIHSDLDALLRLSIMIQTKSKNHSNWTVLKNSNWPAKVILKRREYRKKLFMLPASQAYTIELRWKFKMKYYIFKILTVDRNCEI